MKLQEKFAKTRTQVLRRVFAKSAFDVEFTRHYFYDVVSLSGHVIPKNKTVTLKIRHNFPKQGRIRPTLEKLLKKVEHQIKWSR